MDFLEKDLEDIIYNAPEQEIFDRGLWTFAHDTVLRQVNLGKYGIADLIGITFETERRLVITVYELKQKTISIGTLMQAMGYIRGLQHSQQYFNIKNRSIQYNIVLVGCKIDLSNQFVYAPSCFPGIVTIFTYSYAYNGILFEAQNGYTASGFTPMTGTMMGLADAVRCAYKKSTKEFKQIRDGQKIH